jgi:DNA topoisomerase-3
MTVTVAIRMGKTLVIAEKPSVAFDLRWALGRFERKEYVFENRQEYFFGNDQFVISSAIGHLVEFSLPPETFQKLPIVLEDFPLKPIAKTENRYQLLRWLMERKDIDEIVNACDPGRE